MDPHVLTAATVPGRLTLESDDNGDALNRSDSGDSDSGDRNMPPPAGRNQRRFKPPAREAVAWRPDLEIARDTEHSRLFPTSD